MAADVGVLDDAEPARHLGAHDAARARHQEIVERGLAGMALRHLGAGIVGEIGVVQQRAQQCSLDTLNVHHQVGDRAAEEPVGDDDRGHRRERDRVLPDDVRLAVAHEHLALVAAGRDPVQRGTRAFTPVFRAMPSPS